MKKEIKFNELVSILGKELGRACESNNIGEHYKFFVNNADLMFEDDINYEDYSASYEGDSSFIINCNKKAAYMFLALKRKQGNELDLEIMTEGDTYYEQIETYFTASNTLILNSTLDAFEEIKSLKEIAIKSKSDIKFILEDSSNPDFMLECKIYVDGHIESEGRFDIRMDNRSELFYTALRLMEHFQTSKDTDLAELNIKIYIDSEHSFEEQEVTGVDIINDYLSGNKVDLFEDRNIFMSTLKKYPIIMEIAPKSFWEDREVVITFVKANLTYVNQVESTFKEKESDLNVISSTRGIKLSHINAYKNAMIKKYPLELNKWMEDDEIFTLIIESAMIYNIRFTEDYYNEDVIKGWLIEYPILIGIVYLYWSDKLQYDYKESEHIKRKYRLNDEIQDDMLAGYKAYDLISEFDNILPYLKYLSTHYESSVFIKDIWNDLDDKTKDDLIKFRLPLIDLIKNDIDINNPIIDYIIGFCPEPGAFLSDEIILKRGLNPYEGDKDDLCLGCRKCNFVWGRIR